MIREYRTIKAIDYPLVMVGDVEGVSCGELAELVLPGGETRRCMVLEAEKGSAVLQLFDSAAGVRLRDCRVRFLGHGLELAVSEDMLGRSFGWSGRPIDGGAEILAEAHRSINGAVQNPELRDRPQGIIETGISAVDEHCTPLCGQKLAILSDGGFSGAELAAQIAHQAKLGGERDFAVVYAAIGVSFEEAEFFAQEFRRMGFADRLVSFVCLADEPVARRVAVPRMALTAAEFFAFEKDMQVLVVLSDMTNYADALREISAAKKEPLGRDGYPARLSADIAALFERGGRRVNKGGSITLLPVAAVPGMDLSFPVAEAVVSACDGQIVLSGDEIAGVGRSFNRLTDAEAQKE